MIEKELQKIGLSPKEVKVYTTCLQYGPKSVQDISRFAEINRVTCYVLLENLMDMGLVSKIDAEKGRRYRAEDPKKLLYFLDTREKEIKQRKKRIEKIMPQIQALYNEVGDKPVVRYFEGENALEMLHQFTFESKTKHIDGLVSLDAAFTIIDPKKNNLYRKELVKKKIAVRQIYTSEKYTFDYLPKECREFWQNKKLDHKKFDIPGDMAIYDTFVAIITYRPKTTVIIIEDELAVKMMKTWFELAWIAAEKFEIK